MPITLTRALLVILIPGGISLSSWIFLFILKFDTDASSIYSTYTTPINITFFALIVIIGAIIEGFNTHIEVKWDKERDSDLQVFENWYTYLSHTLQNEPVAFKYISRMVTTMYFELAMMWASVLFGAGLAAIICTIKGNCFVFWAFIFIALSIGALFYFKWQAKTTHEVLCKTRKEFNQRLAANNTL